MDHARAIREFILSVGGTDEIAERYLEMTDWNVARAVQAYIMDADEEEEDQTTADISGSAQSSGGGHTGGQSLGDTSGPAPSIPSSSVASSVPSPPTQQPKKKFGSLADLQSSGPSGPPAADDDDSDKEQEWFTGGDKSGLAVQDPRSRDHIRRLMDTARRNGPRPSRDEAGEDATPSQSAFSGAGQTLGGDDVESEPVAAQNAGGRTGSYEMVERTLHLWADGFSVDDGPLYRYDDPANARTLDMINSGSAPLDIMNVESGQAVDVKLDAHRGENYVQPKQKYKPFGGGGQRLGSPTPGGSGMASIGSATISAPAAASEAQSQATVRVDESQPVIMLQVRLADGTRLPSRFNTTHTIGDVYDFVDRTSSGSSGRPYALATTFPTKELVDKAQVLGDMAEFKRGGVIVQKWS